MKTLQAYSLALFALWQAAVAQIKNSEGLTLLPDGTVLSPNGHVLDETAMYQPIVAALAAGAKLDRNSWSVQSDVTTTGKPAVNQADGTISAAKVPLAHNLVIDMKTSHLVNGVSYQQKGKSGQAVQEHTVDLSTDGNTWTTAAFGTYLDSNHTKVTSFAAQTARFVRFRASVKLDLADFDISIVPNAVTKRDATLGVWGPTVVFPLVPVAMAVLPSSGGKVMAWSADADTSFASPGIGTTQFAYWDPVAGTVTPRTVAETQHDMFCPGISYDINGRIVVSGGDDAPKTSIYDPGTNTWTSGANLNLPRGYHATSTLSNGHIFALGGSFSGALGGKNGEVYDSVANTWTLLPGCPVTPMLTNDAAGNYRNDNHGWLFGWKNNTVFHAGPSKNMNWYGTLSGGSQLSAGTRGTVDSMCGNAIMYDAVAGKILAVGGSVNYDNANGTPDTWVITIGTPNTPATATAVAGLHNARTLGNAVVLPNGQVFVGGGQAQSLLFQDVGAIMTPEIWDPTTLQFTPVNPQSAPRTYHSTALLLPDATVLLGGGGLCGGCSTNHFDAEVFTPPYLLHADGTKVARPNIVQVISLSSLPANTAHVGGVLTVVAGTAVPTTSFVLIRYGTATHGVDTDQRRIPLKINSKLAISVTSTSFKVQIPSDAGIVLPGYYMLFAMANGVPSVSQTIHIIL